MDGILAHPKTKQEAKLIAELFDKMNISYEIKIKPSNAVTKASVHNTPNSVTRRAVRESREGKGKRFTSLTGLFEELKK